MNMPRKKDPEIYEYKLKSGKTRYGFKTYVGTSRETGRPVKITRQGFATRKEAVAAKTKLKVQGGTKIERKRRENLHTKTVDEAWNALYKNQELSLRPTSLYRKQSTYNNAIKPHFGKVYINAINGDHLQNWVNEMAQHYVKYRKVIGTFKEIIKFGLVKGWLVNDPFSRVVIPRTGKKSKKDNKNNYLEANELKDFLNTAYEVSPKAYTFFITTALLGLRRGETLALKWSDLDLKNRVAYISRTVTKDIDGHKTLGPTKTNDKYRKNNGLPISDQLYTVLKNYKESTHSKDDDFVFRNARGAYHDPSSSDKWLNKIYAKNPNLKRITAHGLRHTLASLLFEENKNISVSEVQYMLGHKSARTTLDIYTSVTNKQKQNLKDSVNNLKI